MKHIELALSQVGIKEIVGSQHNPEVLKYFDEIGHDWVDDDETAWCSAFVNWICFKKGLPMSGKLNARSWLNVGAPLEEGCEPQVGDVVVLWRGSKNDWRGHVGFFISNRNGMIYILGGNQNNQVKISAYNQSRLLEYRIIS